MPNDQQSTGEPGGCSARPACYPLDTSKKYVLQRLQYALADAHKGNWKTCFEQVEAARDELWTSGLCVKEDNVKADARRGERK